MIIESLRLFYHIDCFKCCVCCVQLGDGLMGTDVRVRNDKLHCHSCYSNDEGKLNLNFLFGKSPQFMKQLTNRFFYRTEVQLRMNDTL